MAIMMDYVDEPTVASDDTSTALTGDEPALTGEDPALLKLVRKLEVCDAVEDAEERRRFVAKHANSFGLSVADVLSRLRVRGTLSAEEVNLHNTHAHAHEHVVLLSSKTYTLHIQDVHDTYAHARARTHAHARMHARTHASSFLHVHTQVRDWDGKDKELVIVPSPDVPPSELRPATAMQEVSVSSLHEVPQAQAPAPAPAPSPQPQPQP